MLNERVKIEQHINGMTLKLMSCGFT